MMCFRSVALKSARVSREHTPAYLSWRGLILFGAVLCLIGCAAPTSLPTLAQSRTLTLPTTRAPSVTRSLEPSRTITPTVSPTPTVSRAPSASIIIASPQLIVLTTQVHEPDDLVLAPDGSLYFSDVGDGTVKRWTREGGVKVVLKGLGEPEGVVFLPDGALIIAEQKKNRLLRFDLKTKQLMPFANLENNTNQPGVDGILYSEQVHALLVPDSPNGRLLRLNEAGKIISSSPQFSNRATGVAVEPNGALLVTDEFGGTLVRISPNANTPPEIVARLLLPDDVIVDAADNIFVNTLGDDAIHWIDAVTEQDRVLMRGFSDPQGIIFDTDGNLVVADAGHHRLVKLVIH